MAPPNTRRVARIMKALSNENRLRLFLEIATRQGTEFEARGCLISEIMGLFTLSPPAISHHLKELAGAGLITTERRGRFVVAHIDPDAITEIERVLAHVRGA